MMNKTLLILVGPSAVGKTTVADEIMSRDLGFAFMRSLTTRSPRGDGHDDEYIYIDREGFLSEVRTGGVLEHTEYDGTLYGTPRSEVERVLSEGKTPLLILDINGAVSLNEKRGELHPCAIYLTEDDEILKSRLVERYLSDERCDTARYEARMERNRWEREHLAELSPIFHAIISGEATPTLTADAVLSAFDDFKRNIGK